MLHWGAGLLTLDALFPRSQNLLICCVSVLSLLFSGYPRSEAATLWACQLQACHFFECRIADPEATKPEDWDEDAPREISDEEAEKPEGWLDDEPQEIDDPGALRYGCWGAVSCR